MEQSVLKARIAGLSQKEQEQLFREAAFGHKANALEIILDAVKIKPELLREAFYHAATYNHKITAKVLIDKPDTDINWSNEDNWNLTSGMRAAMNDHKEIVNMIFDRADFDPNVVVIDRRYSGVDFEKTILTQEFGYTPKNKIKRPKEAWKRRLLRDRRVDWNLHNELIEKREKMNPVIAQQDNLKAQLRPIKRALGL
jgi:hypothetical protein